jgi:hypothetical protein
MVVAAGVMISAKACNLHGSRMASRSIAQLANICQVVVCVNSGSYWQQHACDGVASTQ